MYLPFLPFEEASLNPADQAFVTALGSKVTSWGAQAWQAALAFKQAVDSDRGQERAERPDPCLPPHGAQGHHQLHRRRVAAPDSPARGQ